MVRELIKFQSLKSLLLLQGILCIVGFDSAHAKWDYKTCKEKCTQEQCAQDQQLVDQCEKECSMLSRPLVDQCIESYQANQQNAGENEDQSEIAQLQGWIKGEEGYLACLKDMEKSFKTQYTNQINSVNRGLQNLKRRLEDSNSQSRMGSQQLVEPYNDGYKGCLIDFINKLDPKIPGNADKQDYYLKVMDSVDVSTTKKTLFKFSDSHTYVHPATASSPTTEQSMNMEGEKPLTPREQVARFERWIKQEEGYRACARQLPPEYFATVNGQHGGELFDYQTTNSIYVLTQKKENLISEHNIRDPERKAVDLQPISVIELADATKAFNEGYKNCLQYVMRENEGLSSPYNPTVKGDKEKEEMRQRNLRIQDILRRLENSQRNNKFFKM